MKYLQWMSKTGYKLDIILGIIAFSYGLYVDSILWILAGYVSSCVGFFNPYKSVIDKIQFG